MPSKMSCPQTQLTKPKDSEKEKGEWLMVIKGHDFHSLKYWAVARRLHVISRTPCQIVTLSWWAPQNVASFTAICSLCHVECLLEDYTTVPVLHSGQWLKNIIGLGFLSSLIFCRCRSYVTMPLKYPLSQPHPLRGEKGKDCGNRGEGEWERGMPCMEWECYQYCLRVLVYH